MVFVALVYTCMIAPRRLVMVKYINILMCFDIDVQMNAIIHTYTNYTVTRITTRFIVESV